ncbi:retrovirus-related pol polyprotein from transposon TNT 1-94 [Tanacetum coccineum]|uniref:Retrovirus-related pol polyprotein from transposon TNT 1-94 n=1 Tax=Tanacetum coccineum TaxID=301880 RepID=A0ABQ5D727_9ASTR
MVMEMARSMLYEKKLPKTFWAEAVATSVYLLNRLATKAVSDIKRSKLDAKARKGIIVGYATASKGYRIYDLTNSKIVISRDVSFDEGAYLDWNVDEVKRHEDTFSNETHHDKVNIPEFDIEDTTETDVLRTRRLIGVYESCNSIIEPESYMNTSKHSEWIDSMKAELEMIKKNNTWKLVDLPKGKNAIGFEVVGQEEKVYWLYKALYGLKQALRAWYAKIDAHLLTHNFKRSSNMGLVSYFLGIEIKQLPNGVHISQRKYASDMLKKFKMFLCKPVTSPLVYKCKLSKDDGKKLVNPTRFRSIVGSLLYLTISRPDLAFAASFLSRFMGEPSSSRLGAVKRVLRYVKGSLDLEIMFERNKVVKLEGYDDKGPTVIFRDNKSAITIAKNPVQHGRTKHINVKYHAIREAEKNEEVKLKYCTSETQLADMLTKSITGKKLNYIKAQIMKSNNNLKEECQRGSILALETLKRVVVAGNRARDALVAQGLSFLRSNVASLNDYTPGNDEEPKNSSTIPLELPFKEN